MLKANWLAIGVLLLGLASTINPGSSQDVSPEVRTELVVKNREALSLSIDWSVLCKALSPSQNFKQAFTGYLSAHQTMLTLVKMKVNRLVHLKRPSPQYFLPRKTHPVNEEEWFA